MKKRTKIVATLGPASDSLEMITALIRAGVNLFRLNFSHGSHEYHSEVLGRIRQAVSDTGLITGVLQDISGPKIRVGKLEDDFVLRSGDTMLFVRDEMIGEKVSEGNYTLTISQPSILDQLRLGDAIYLCDGAIRAVVSEITGEGVRVEVENEGLLSSRKGVNFPNTRLGIDVLTPKDRKDIEWGVKNGVDYMAISFVQSADDMRRARKLVESLGGDTQLIAKIEKFDAIEAIDDILAESDGLMVARGDLGIEIPYYEVPNTQKMLIQKANNAHKPVITATQMLLSMTTKESATRAEISDIANAVHDGTDAVMLSEESAVGHNPVLAVETMVKTIQGAERYFKYHRYWHYDYFDAGDHLDESAVRLSQTIECAGIIAVTSSGASARKKARYRPSHTIYAVTHDKRIASRLTLVWGVVPAFTLDKEKDLTAMIEEVIDEGLERGVFGEEKSYILTAGDCVGVSGRTNMIKVITPNEMPGYQEKYGRKE